MNLLRHPEGRQKLAQADTKIAFAAPPVNRPEAINTYLPQPSDKKEPSEALLLKSQHQFTFSE